jgi:hypothetical protein
VNFSPALPPASMRTASLEPSSILWPDLVSPLTAPPITRTSLSPPSATRMLAFEFSSTVPFRFGVESSVVLPGTLRRGVCRFTSPEEMVETLRRLRTGPGSLLDGDQAVGADVDHRVVRR